MPPLLRLLLLIGFDPSLADSADAIPGQSPTALVIESEPPDARVLRGDYEIPERVVLVYTDLWPGETAAIAEHVLAGGGQVSIALQIEDSGWRLERLVRRLGERHEQRIELLDASFDTTWVRDWGPIQLRRGGQALWLDADYDDTERERDDDAPRLISEHFDVGIEQLQWPLDGGAVISNGEGLCVLTLEYLDEQGIVCEQDDLGSMLSQLGCRATAVVPTLIKEETKHADMIAQFVTPERLMIVEPIDEFDGAGEDSLRIAAAEKGIRRAAATLGIDLEVFHVPTPTSGANDITRSYVNGLRLEDRYLMPSYPELPGRWDTHAWEVVQAALEDVPVVPVAVSEMIDSGGAIHCTTLGLFGI